MFARLTVLCLALGAASAHAGPCPQRASWPTKGWPDATEATLNNRPQQIAALDDFAFTLIGADGDRLGLRSDGLLIIKHGAIIYEKYGRGFGPDNKHVSWSVAKSVSSMLTGVAVQRGALTLDDSICQHLTEYDGKDVCRIKVKDPLTFASGLYWEEGYENADHQASSVIAMLFGVGHQDNLAHILGHKVVHDPGTHWQYSTGDAGLVASVAKRALEKVDGKDAFWTDLFNKLGAKVAFEEDPKGHPQGGMNVYASPRDYAKLGYLMLNDGCWAPTADAPAGERILPEGWVKASTTPSDVFVSSASDKEDTPSGYSWWLNAAVPSRSHPKPWKDAPDDAYMADGHWGQKIIVIPSEDLIIVRTGDDRNGSMDDNALITLSLAVAK